MVLRYGQGPEGPVEGLSCACDFTLLHQKLTVVKPDSRHLKLYIHYVDMPIDAILVYLRGNCIKNFHLEEVYRQTYSLKFRFVCSWSLGAV